MIWRIRARAPLIAGCILVVGLCRARAVRGQVQGTEQFETIEILVGDMQFDALAAGPADGPLVLLLHGFPETSYSWRHQLGALARAGYRAVAPDQRGYSPGARPEGVAAYAVPNLVLDVVGMADALGADRFHLVGHDWGGAVAWVVALQHANRLRSLTVFSTPHVTALAQERARPDSDQAARSSYFADFAAADAELRFLEDDAALLRSVYAGLDRATVDVYVRALGNRPAMRAALAWYAAAFGGSGNSGGGAATQPQAPPPIQVPTLYIWGTEDVAFGRAAAEATRAHVIGTAYTFEVLDGVGHWIMEQAPDRSSELLLAHLAGAGGG